MHSICYTYIRCGVWRSLVARTAGGREVAGSNPVAPIKYCKIKGSRSLNVCSETLFVLLFDYLLVTLNSVNVFI